MVFKRCLLLDYGRFRTTFSLKKRSTEVFSVDYSKELQALTIMSVVRVQFPLLQKPFRNEWFFCFLHVLCSIIPGNWTGGAALSPVETLWECQQQPQLPLLVKSCRLFYLTTFYDFKQIQLQQGCKCLKALPFYSSGTVL